MPKIALEITCDPKDRDFSCLIRHLKANICLADSCFQLNQYLEMKGEKDWNTLYDLKSKSFYESFPLFFNTIVKAVEYRKNKRGFLLNEKVSNGQNNPK